jgi:hypothetical protein
MNRGLRGFRRIKYGSMSLIVISSDLRFANVVYLQSLEEKGTMITGKDKHECESEANNHETKSYEQELTQSAVTRWRSEESR